ncbi:MAG: methyltransferase domain-containing protein [Candidatus Paceibacterota bacterium]
MPTQKLEIKLSFIEGLRDIVLRETRRSLGVTAREGGEDSLYIDCPDILAPVKGLGSVARAYLVARDRRYNPLYVSNHKSIIGQTIETILSAEPSESFKTFKVTCAGSGSSEARGIAAYIEETYRLVEAEEADLKVHIIKLGECWEVGAQITPRPLSLRAYKVRNMSGAMDPTIAYAMNSLCGLERVDSYLNVFSGSGTLLVEAGLRYPNIGRLVGFDNDKKHVSLAIQNVKEAGLIKRVSLREADILEEPDLGTFDVIASDLPFGMSISKGEDLGALYRCFVEYCEGALGAGGVLAVYTSEHHILEELLKKSNFQILKTIDLRFVTSVDAYLRPRIFLCGLRNGLGREGVYTK